MEKGLYNKYTIINNETSKEVEGEYFVLKPAQDKAARAAILEYANVTRNKELKSDLRMWIRRLIENDEQNRSV